MLSNLVSAPAETCKDPAQYGFLPEIPGLLSSAGFQPAQTLSARLILDALPLMAWITECDGKISFLNKRWAEYMGVQNSELLSGIELLKYLHPEDVDNMTTTWMAAKQSGTTFQVEYRWLRASDNSYRWHLGRAVPVRNADNEIINWIGTCTDIEEQKQNEKFLRDKNAELNQINTDLDSFVYMASHDLKLPAVNSAALFEELLPLVKFSDPEGPKIAGLIQASLNQLQQTIHQLANIVKVQREVNALIEEIDLAQLLKEVEAEINVQICEAGAVIHSDFSQVPSVRFSRINFKSMLYNLLSNSVKFRSPHQTPVINVRTYRISGGFCLEVSDNGVGIDLGRHGEKMFQMFRRFHNHVKGSGLGLYLVNRIMQNNGGSVKVKSTPGAGATFTLCFNETRKE